MIPLHDDNPTERFPFVTVIVIILCVGIYLYQGSLPEPSEESFVFQYGAVPALVFGHASLPEDIPAPVPVSMTLLTSMFPKRCIQPACRNILVRNVMLAGTAGGMSSGRDAWPKTRAGTVP